MQLCLWKQTNKNPSHFQPPLPPHSVHPVGCHHLSFLHFITLIPHCSFPSSPSAQNPSTLEKEKTKKGQHLKSWPLSFSDPGQNGSPSGLVSLHIRAFPRDRNSQSALKSNIHKHKLAQCWASQLYLSLFCHFFLMSSTLLCNTPHTTQYDKWAKTHKVFSKGHKSL